MQGLTQTRRLLCPHWGLSTASPQMLRRCHHQTWFLISPLLHFSNSLFTSLLSSGHARQFQVRLWAWVAWPHQQPEHKPFFFSGVLCQRGYFTAPDRNAASPILSRKYPRFMFDIYDPAPRGLPQTEQPMRKSRLESVSKRLLCTFTVTNMQMSSQPGFHPCSFYFRRKTQPSRGKPADELDCSPWLFFYWSHVDHTSICVVSVKVCPPPSHPHNPHWLSPKTHWTWRHIN